jgi:hypothetical protein
MPPGDDTRTAMNYASHTQVPGHEVTALAMTLPATGSTSLKATMLNARDGLMIIGYQLMIRVFFLARRWNY